MRVDSSQFIVSDKSYNTRFYTLVGNESFLDEDGFPRLETETSMVFAKAVQNKPSKNFETTTYYRYFIKTNPNKVIHNPIEIYSTKSKDNMSFLNKICKTETVFTEVPHSIFDQYITFLKTKSTRWLDSAQRELK
jgi:hypothetical protein